MLWKPIFHGTGKDKCISCLTSGAIKFICVHSCERAIPNDERSHFLEGGSRSGSNATACE
jgi:hypothetical protein